jgi:hypothetical protein
VVSKLNQYEEDGLFAVIAADSTDITGLGDSINNVIPVLDDEGAMMYYDSAYYSNSGFEVLLVAAGGEIVAGGEYASDISDEDYESVLD